MKQRKIPSHRLGIDFGVPDRGIAWMRSVGHNRLVSRGSAKSTVVVSGKTAINRDHRAGVQTACRPFAGRVNLDEVLGAAGAGGAIKTGELVETC